MKIFFILGYLEFLFSTQKQIVQYCDTIIMTLLLDSECYNLQCRLSSGK